MTDNRFSRTEMLIGKENIDRLKSCHVAVFGVGGVGSYAVEALARSGIGHFSIIDADTVSESNINRQIIATTSTVGRQKAEVAKERILEINPSADVEIYPLFFSKETAKDINLDGIDYIVDAIDSVESKVTLILTAKEREIPVISSMGTGNKLDPTRLEVSDISKTSVCPLARVMRKKLGILGVKHLKVVYSKEDPIKTFVKKENGQPTADRERPVTASIAFVPSVAGLIIAGEVIKDICNL